VKHYRGHGYSESRTNDYYHESARKRLWDRVRKSTGIDKELRLYDATRHSFASQQLEAGTDIAEIKEMVGHSDIRTTMKYAHPSLEKMRANLEKLSLKKVVGWGSFGAQQEKEEKKAVENQAVR